MRRASRARRTCLLALLVGVLAAQGAGAREPRAWPAALDARVQEIARELPGELMLYVRDVSSGEEYGYSADDVTYLSSTIKVLVALTVLHQVDAGTLSLGDTLVFGPGDVRDGVGPLRHRAPGARFTVQALLELMLVRSDNAAADLLIGLVGTEGLRQELGRRGIHFGPVVPLLEERRRIYGTLDARAAQLAPTQVRELGREDALGPRAQVLSRMLDHSPPWTGEDLADAFEAFYASGVNSASMREMGRLLEQVARCDGLSRRNCGRLHALMAACRTGAQRLRAGLPDGVVWEHKTGTQHRRACDVGVLKLGPGRAVVVAACMRDFTSVTDAEAAFARLGRALWESLERT